MQSVKRYSAEIEKDAVLLGFFAKRCASPIGRSHPFAEMRNGPASKSFQGLRSSREPRIINFCLVNNRRQNGSTPCRLEKSSKDICPLPGHRGPRISQFPWDFSGIMAAKGDEHSSGWQREIGELLVLINNKVPLLKFTPPR